MIDNQPIAATPVHQTGKTSIQDRSVLVGDIIIINGYKINRASLKQRFSEGGYQTQEMPHFLLFTRQEAPATILVHRFAPEVPASDIQDFITAELQLSGLFKQADEKTILKGILDSFEMQEIHMRERSVSIGDISVMNGYGLNLRALKKRLLQSGYQIQETPHFLFCTGGKVLSTVLVHWFAPDDLHTNISRHLVEEMRPFGCIANSMRLGELMTGILGTTLPDHIRRAWNYFGANTLQRLLLLVSTATPDIPPDYGTLEMSATLYQRVLELCAGKRFLDAGCNNGFFDLLLAERRPFVEEVVGVDIDRDVFRVAEELARGRDLTTVRFVQADLLSKDIDQLGPFDTVTALHVLEHFTESDMYRILENLLKVTIHHLILAVPYEETPTNAYDHLQCFSHAKLENVGRWCIEQMNGAGRIWCEDQAGGGLLLIERMT